MKAKTLRQRLLVFCLLALACGGVFYTAGTGGFLTNRAARAPVRSQAAATVETPEIPGRRGRPELPLSTPPLAPADDLLENSIVRETRETPGPSGSFVRSKLLESPFKYPAVQLDEFWEQSPGAEPRRIRRTFHVADHAMMRFPADLDFAAIRNWCANRGFRIRGKLATDDVFLIQSPSPAIDAAAKLIAEFTGDFGKSPAALAEPDYLQFATVIPADTRFNSLWGLHNTGQSSGNPDADIDAPEAWELSTGSRDVLVGVIDTGIDPTHPDLAPNMWANPGEIAGNGIDDDGNGFIDDTRGWDFYSNDSDPSDLEGHGTHVAGTIGAVGGNGEGVAGVNWQVSMVSLRFLGPNGVGDTADAVDAVNYANAMGYDITSNSWGGGGFSGTLEQAIRAAGTAGQLFIAAAGNDASDNDAIPSYPGGYDSDCIISVASSTRKDTLSSFSNRGLGSVDIVAPGSEILSTTPANTYSISSGTSMAAPHVSGAAALLYALSPTSSPATIKQTLISTADPIPALASVSRSGGRLNLHRAALALAGPRVLPHGITLTEISGNGDGVANPGETIGIAAAFRNVGADPATGVIASILLEGPAIPGVSATGGPFPAGDLAAGTSGPIFNFILTLDASLDTPLALPLAFSAGDSNGKIWKQPYPLTVYISSAIQGAVTRLADGAAVQGATISYNGPKSGTATTDAAGIYSIPAINGTYTIHASAPGYVASTIRQATTPPDASGIDFQLGTPALQISPADIEESLPSGDSVTRSILLSNPGNAPLTWSTSTEYGALITGNLPARASSGYDPDRQSAATATAIGPLSAPLSDLQGVDLGLLVSGIYPSFVLDMTDRGASTSTITLPLVAASLAGLEVLVIDDRAVNLSPSDISIIRNWVDGGGGLLVEGDNGTSTANNNAVLSGSGIAANSLNTFFDETFTDIGLHPSTEDVTSIRAGAYGSFLTVSGSARMLARNAQQRVFSAATTFGSGRIVAAGNEITLSSDWGIGDTRRFVNQVIGWLAFRSRWLQIAEPRSGTIPAGNSQVIEVTLDAANLDAGVYDSSLVIHSDLPGIPRTSIPIRMNVSGSPAMFVDPASIAFPRTRIGMNSSAELILSNPGSEILELTQISCPNPAFTTGQTLPIQIAPRQSIAVEVTFQPMAPGDFNAILEIVSDDPTDPVVPVGLTGQAVAGPEFAVSPGSFSLSMPFGTRRVEELAIGNTGDADLVWSIGFSQPGTSTADPLATTLAALDTNYRAITGLIPARHDFSGGTTGNSIADGGDDMFDGGNFLSTSLQSSGYISYSDGIIAPAPASLGPDGRYFTRKYPGLFIFGAEMDGVPSFHIGGELGADGRGTVDGGDLTVNHRGRVYRGFFKRVNGAGDPSVNHLIIVEDTPSLVHSFSADTNEDDDHLAGLAGSRHLYYLLYASKAGGYIGGETIRQIMMAFLQSAELGPSWVYTDPVEGSTSPGTTSHVAMTFDATRDAPGIRTGFLLLHNNQANRPVAALPLSLEILPSPVIRVDRTEMVFEETPAGSVRRQVLTVSNNGYGILNVTPSVISGAGSFSNAGPATTVIHPGESGEIAVDFNPLEAGTAAGTLVLESNAAGPPIFVSLRGSTGTGVNFKVTPPEISMTLAAGTSSSRTISIDNPGPSPLAWTASPYPASTGMRPGEPLSGLDVLIVSNASSNYDDLLAKLAQRGAKTTFVPYEKLSAVDFETAEIIFIDYNIENLSSSLVQPLRDWVLAGGGLVIQHPFTSFPITNVILASSGIGFASAELIPACTVDSVFKHSSTRGITLLTASSFYSALSVSAPAVRLFDLPSGAAFAAASTVGGGRVIAISDDIFTDTTAATGQGFGFAAGAAAWVARRTADWLDLSAYSGTAPAPGASAPVVSVDATDLLAGDYHAEILVSSIVSPGSQIGIPVRLTVTGSPVVSASPARADFPATFIGHPREITLELSNTGKARLIIEGLDFPAPGITTDTVFPRSIMPGMREILTLRHAPSATLDFDGFIAVRSNDPATPVLQVPSTGRALIAPVIAVDTSPLHFDLPGDATATIDLDIGNTGGSDLLWSIPPTIEPDATTLDEFLVQMDANKSSFSSAIPFRYDFRDGITGDRIDDGGADMFDYGNYLHTDLSPAAAIPYSNGSIHARPEALGPNGRYFTRKYPGLFVFAAELDGVSSFRIDGLLGADGSGFVDGSTITAVHENRVFRGFIKRVFGAGDSSVNHLVIVEDKPGLDHSFSLDSNSDFHEITGLGDSTCIFYLLFGTESGGYVDDVGIENLMATFLSGTLGGTAFWQVSPAMGSVAAGGVSTSALTVKSSSLVPGTYHSNVMIQSNDPLRPAVPLPVSMTVSPTPRIQCDPVSAAFPGTFAGYSSAELPLVLTNPGNSPLSISSIETPAGFTISSPLPITIAAGEDEVLEIRFTPEAPGDYSGNLVIHSDAANEPTLVIPTSATGIAPPLAVADRVDIHLPLQIGLTADREIDLSNPGGSPLEWSIDPGDLGWAAVTPAAGTIPAGSSATLHFTFDASGLESGTYQSILPLATNSPASPEIGISLQLDVLPPFTVNPAALQFGEIMMGDSRTLDITVLSTSGISVSVAGAPVSGGPFTASPPAGAAISNASPPVRIPVTFTPGTEGASHQMLIITSGAGPVVFSVAGTGIAPGEFPIAAYSAWRAIQFESTGILTGTLDDWDADARPNFFEFAFGLDPRRGGDPNPLVLTGRSAGSVHLRYLRHPAFPDSLIDIEESTNLLTWIPAPSFIRHPDEPENGTTRVNLVIPDENQPALYFRGKVRTR